jgi:ABC-type antimicrobial peptide transport system permease subunit
MLVASIGLYGIFAYTITQRTAELGLRLALGATRTRVRWMVLRQVGLTAMIGGAVGILSALVAGRAAQALLFGLEFHDAGVLGLAVVVLTFVAFAAGFVPADRACRVDPIRALKYE